jgi:hypothetical protein
VAKVSQERWIEPRFAGITAGVVTVILYGSLYPFQFHDDHFGTGPFKALFANWRQIPDWSDIVSNVLLYIPFGCLRFDPCCGLGHSFGFFWLRVRR